MSAVLDVLLAPERRAAALEEQTRLRKLHGNRVVTDPALIHFFWGQQLEASILKTLQPDDFTSHGSHLLQRLSDACAAQARFSEAASLTSDPAQQATYEAYANAITNAGTRQCNCAPVKIFPLPNNAKGHPVDSLRDILNVSDGTRGFVLRQCYHCGAISAYEKR